MLYKKFTGLHKYVHSTEGAIFGGSTISCVEETLILNVYQRQGRCIDFTIKRISPFDDLFLLLLWNLHKSQEQTCHLTKRKEHSSPDKKKINDVTVTLDWKAAHNVSN